MFLPPFIVVLEPLSPRFHLSIGYPVSPSICVSLHIPPLSFPLLPPPSPFVLPFLSSYSSLLTLSTIPSTPLPCHLGGWWYLTLQVSHSPWTLPSLSLLVPLYSPSSSLSPVPSSRMFLLNFLACGLNPLVLLSGGGMMIPDDTVVSLALDTSWSLPLSSALFTLPLPLSCPLKSHVSPQLPCPVVSTPLSGHLGGWWYLSLRFLTLHWISLFFL